MIVATITPISPTNTPLPTNTIIPTATQLPTNTPTTSNNSSSNCTNSASFISDITIPDNTILLPTSAFTKTWRLKNVGTCSWSAGYKLVFSHGERMNAPSEVPLSGNVLPGQTIDISVNLIAPDAENLFRGDYKLKDLNGQLFALSNGSTFYVQIESRAIAPPSQDPQNNNPPPILGPAAAMEVFQVVEADSSTYGGFLAKGTFILGDTFANFGFAGFIRFDLSNIPDGVTITDAVLSFPGFIVDGDPFNKLGCVRLFMGDYFPVSPDDVAFPGGGASATACSLAEMNYIDMNVDHLNSFLGAGMSSLEFLVVFNQLETNTDNVTDSLEATNQILNTTLQIEYLQ